ncbi:unnamed protein product, partial [Polarella glacialis]
SGKLFRAVGLVEVSIACEVASARLKLVQEEQFLDDGRRRSFPQRRPHVKLGRGEAPLAAAQRVLCRQLGLSNDQCTTAAGLMIGGLIGSFGEAANQVVEATSSSYPGLRTRYVIHPVDLELPHLRSDGKVERSRACSTEVEAIMALFNLPSARTFMTVEGNLGAGNGGRVHLWNWTLAEDRSLASDSHAGLGSLMRQITTESSYEQQDDDGGSSKISKEDQDASGIEETYRDLLGVYRILQGQKALLSERGGHQELRLGDAEERIKRVLAKMTNIEGL